MLLGGKHDRPLCYEEADKDGDSHSACKSHKGSVHFGQINMALRNEDTEKGVQLQDLQTEGNTNSAEDYQELDLGDRTEMDKDGAYELVMDGESVDTDSQPEMEQNKMNSQISTMRAVMDQNEFDEYYNAGPRPKTSIKEYFASIKEGCECSGRCVKKKITGFFPFVKVLKNYSVKDDLVGDIVAGLTVGIMQIPQGMAYAMLASLQPEYGLYTSLFPVLLYFLFGTSRHVSVGTFAVVSLMVGSTVDKYCVEDGAQTTDMPYTGSTEGWGNNTTISDGPSDEYKKCTVEVATAVTFLGGIVQLVMAICRLGFVTIYLSEAMTRGFTTGCSIHVFSSQIKYVFGVEVGRYSGPWKLIYTYGDLFRNLGDTNPAAVVLSVICMVVIYITKEYINPPVKKRIKAPIPIDLIVVIIATVASALANFEEIFDMQIVGEIPTGLPPPQFPPPSRYKDVFVDSITVAIVAFAISVSMVQLFAKKHDYDTDSNQELLSHGLCNVISANLNCYMMCVSLSRSVVQEAIGCKSQLTALFSSGLIAIVIIFIATYFEALPNCVLAAIIIVALKGMFMQFKDIPKYWKISGTDLSTWLVTFIAVVLLDVGYGLMVGVAYSLLTVVGRTQKPYCAIEGRIPDSDIYKDVDVYGKAEEIEGVKIVRFDGAIYYANSTYFVEQVYEKSQCNGKKIKLQTTKVMAKIKKWEKQNEQMKLKLENQEKSMENGIASMEEGHPFEIPKPSIHHVVLDCTTISYVDAMGVQVLRQVCSEYKEIGVVTYLAGCKAGVRQMLEVGGFHERFDKDILYPCVHDAVVDAVADHPKQRSTLEMIMPDEVHTSL